ncbi:hypothetical protein [Oceanospirillum sediminis]|uniref:Uncharacterized protein n=1 Tax=Oceanospirillum sediminis TaxID=2760088 RepID=A0A839IKM1_9GAMM|nr:hypothetical protein [Oceanospirillum sediminis]MBB1485274.1 hypothetical protein [Oceanospirillum sediminis]
MELYSQTCPVLSMEKSQAHVRYSLFVLVLPVFFILPLAMFSLWESWSLLNKMPAVNTMNLYSSQFFRADGASLYAWSLLIQGCCQLIFVLLTVAGYWLVKRSLTLMAYLVLLSSVVLQWQLPSLVAGV